MEGGGSSKGPRRKVYSAFCTPTKTIQIIQCHDAQTHKTANNDVSLAFRLQVIAQERCTLLTVGALKNALDSCYQT